MTHLLSLTIIQGCFAMFYCKSAGSITFVSAYPNLLCTTPRYYMFLSAAVCMLVLTALLYAWMAYQVMADAQADSLAAPLLTKVFRASYSLWFIAVLVRKIVISALVTFLPRASVELYFGT
jgi:hypothetical protein